MINYFDESEVLIAEKQRKKTLFIFWAVVALYILLSVALWVIYYFMPYQSANIAIIKAVHYSVTAIFVIFCFIYLGIPFKRVNRYYKFVSNLKTGIRETSEATFIGVDEEIQQKDGVDCKALLFSEWNKYKKEFFERKALVFYDGEFPEIPEGAKVKFVTQGNFLTEYEIIERTKE